MNKTNVTSQVYLSLGYPLDQMLNREIGLAGPDKHPSSPLGGIRLSPGESTSGTGNIIIRGKPGSGKSTLAMQMAIAGQTALSGNNQKPIVVQTAFISLEQDVRDVFRKARLFGWEKHLRPMSHMHNIETPPSSERLADILEHVFYQPVNCPFQETTPSLYHDIYGDNYDFTDMEEINRHVLLPMLAPRNLIFEEGEDRLFWDRFRQLEVLLQGAAALRKRHSETNGPLQHALRLVCIDSLNVFGDRPLTREALHRLFDLFRRYETIGVFVLEEDPTSSDPATDLTRDIAEYVADMVINLDAVEERGYFMRYFEIVKSRYQHQTYGRHPFKLEGMRRDDPEDKVNLQETATQQGTEGEKKTELSSSMFRPQHGIVVYPSLHYLVSATDPKKLTVKVPKKWKQEQFSTGVRGLDAILPLDLPRGSVVAIEGPRDTFKATFGLSFLYQGICGGESVLLIRFMRSAENLKSCE